MQLDIPSISNMEKSDILFFASNAIYSNTVMPRSLQIVANLNPLTYEVDALRLRLLPGFAGTPNLG